MISGSILFPFVGVILYNAYQRTHSLAALCYIGLIAALIKAVNFFLPNINMFKVLNPMMSIIVEALVVVLVIKLVTSNNRLVKYSALPIASVGWRVIFVGWMSAQAVLTTNVAPYLSTMPKIVSFFLIEGLISGLLASGLLFVSERVKVEWRWDKQPLLASSMFLLAVVITYFIA